jgi:hypothetical protein
MRCEAAVTSACANQSRRNGCDSPSDFFLSETRVNKRAHPCCAMFVTVAVVVLGIIVGMLVFFGVRQIRTLQASIMDLHRLQSLVCTREEIADAAHSAVVRTLKSRQATARAAHAPPARAEHAVPASAAHAPPASAAHAAQPTAEHMVEVTAAHMAECRAAQTSLPTAEHMVEVTAAHMAECRAEQMAQSKAAQMADPTAA